MTLEFVIQILIASFGVPVIVFFLATLLPGIERKIQARIQQRIGPGILTPGFFVVFKFIFKHKPIINSSMPTLYKWCPVIGIVSMYLIVIFSTPQWAGIIGLGTLVAMIGLMKVEEMVYLVMGFFSRSPLSITMPFPDLPPGAKHRTIRRYPLETWGSIRAWKMIILASLPLYIALFIPAAATGTINLNEIVQAQLRNGPLLFTLPGILGAVTYFIGYLAMLNEYPFSILKAKSDMIEGPLLELASSWRAAFYVMRQGVLFVLSSLFVTLYIGIPLDPLNPVHFVSHLVLVFILPVALSIASAFSPILTFRQIIPISAYVSVLGFITFILTIGAGMLL